VAQCTWYGNCIEYASMSSCDRLCQQDANTIKCTNSLLPYCYSYMMPDTSIGFFQCDSTTYSLLEEFDSTFSGDTDGRTWSTLFDTGVAVAPDSTSPSSGGAAPSSPLAPVEQKKKAPVGAIVGGVVAGLAFLCGIIGAVVFYLKRSKRQNTATNNA
ncbi:hypothetical protein LTS18_012857, partial [Coniosporium uncinatum]